MSNHENPEHRVLVCENIGVGRFRILGGGQGLEYWGRGGGGGSRGQIPSRHMTSHRRHFNVMCPLGFSKISAK